jgi:hypothetical protein
MKMMDIFQMTPDRSRLDRIVTSGADQHAVVGPMVEQLRWGQPLLLLDLKSLGISGPFQALLSEHDEFELLCKNQVEADGDCDDA